MTEVAQGCRASKPARWWTACSVHEHPSPILHRIADHTTTFPCLSRVRPRSPLAALSDPFPLFLPRRPLRPLLATAATSFQTQLLNIMHFFVRDLSGNSLPFGKSGQGIRILIVPYHHLAAQPTDSSRTARSSCSQTQQTCRPCSTPLRTARPSPSRTSDSFTALRNSCPAGPSPSTASSTARRSVSPSGYAAAPRRSGASSC